MAVQITVKNPGGVGVWIYDLGILIPAAGERNLSLEFSDSEIAKSSDLKTLVDAATLVLNDGSQDLSISQADEVFNEIMELELTNTFATSGTLEATLARDNSAGVYSINMNGNQVTSLAGPTLGTDATNKTYVDTLVAATSGAASTPDLTQVLTQGNDAGGLQIVNIGDATLDTDVPSWGQVQTLVEALSGAETLAQILAKGNSAGSYDINMNNNQINNLADGTLTTDAVNLGQVQTLIETATGGINLQTVTDNGSSTTNGITVGGASTFQNDLTVEGDLYVQGTEYITVTEVVSGSVIVGGELHVDGDSYLGNTTTDMVYVSGGLNVGQNVDISGTLTVDGAVTFNDTLDMTNGQINNVADASIETDAPNWGQVQTLVAAVSASHNELSEILANGNTTGGYDIDFGNDSTAINLTDPVNPQDAATKNYIDTVVANVSGTLDLQLITDNGNTTSNSITVAGITDNGDLTVTGNTTLGDTVSGDTVTINSTTTSYGKLILDTTAQTYAALTITPNATGAIPSTALGAGQIIVVGDRMYMYDVTRSKFLSVERLPFTYGRGAGNQSSQYLRMTGDTISSVIGYLMPYNGTLLGIASDSRNVCTYDIQFRKNDSLSALATLSIVAATGGKDFSYNVDFSANDQLQCYMNVPSGQVDYPEAWFYVAWRV